MSHKIAVYGQRDLVDPFNLTLDNINPITMAHSLALLNRYTGHTRWPYSVAQHTCYLIDAAPDHLKRAMAMHDWNEPFMNDLAHPVKSVMPEYRDLETRIHERIYTLMEEPLENLKACNDLDRRICINEMQVLFRPFFQPDWVGYSMEPLPEFKIEEWDWRRSEIEVLERFWKVL